MDLSAWIDRHAEFTPDKPALIYEGEAISYADLSERVRARAAELKSRFGIRRGDRVAYLGLNSPEFLTLLFACARLGALFIPLNWRLASPEHTYILQDAGAKILVVEDDFREQAETMRAGLPDCDFVASDFSAPDWQKLGEEGVFKRRFGRNPHVDLTLPLLLVYTSGTTGHPKGAVLTQEALQWNAFNSLHMHDMTSADRILTVLPMFHVGGLNIQTTPALYIGATVVLHRKFDPEAVFDAVEQERPDVTVLVPATIGAMMAHPRWERADFSSLRTITTGSSSVPLQMIEAFHARDVPVLQVYGSTETCPIAIYLKAGDAVAKIGSTGKPALNCEMRIVDDFGSGVSPGESGEILIKGPNVMHEYWGNSAATAEALQDGWFHTGDIGYRDRDGFVFVNDRKKDVVISGGENIYPAELEMVLAGMEEVQTAVVVGRDDAKWGQVPVAVIIPQPGAQIERETILRKFDGVLARFKHPKDVVVVEDLPSNAMGKIQKFAVRTMINEMGSGK